MNRLESWLLHLSSILLTVTGLIYVYMHYFLKPADPFAVVNHPWEPHLLKAHILIAPVLIFAVGLITRAHIYQKLQTGSRVGKKSGTSMLPLFLVMVISGYLLQAITSDLRKVMVIIHLASGVLWFLSFVIHQIASYAIRKNMVRVQNGRDLYSKLTHDAPLR